MNKAIAPAVLLLTLLGCQGGSRDKPPFEFEGIEGKSPFGAMHKGDYSIWIYAFDSPAEAHANILDNAIKSQFPDAKSSLRQANGKSTWQFKHQDKLYFVVLSPGKLGTNERVDPGFEATHSYLEIFTGTGK